MVKKKAEKKEKIDKKQFIVGLIILLVAGLVLGYSFYDMNKSDLPNSPKTGFKRILPTKKEMKSVNVVFETTTEKNFEYQIYYTQSMDEDFTEEASVKVKNKAGTNTYKATLPVEKIARLRINFRVDTDNILIKSIKLDGTQEADLSNVSDYIMGQCDNVDIKDDGSFSMTIMDENAYILYMQEIGKSAPQEESTENSEETPAEGENASEIKENQEEEATSEE